MTKVFVEQPLALPGSANDSQCNAMQCNAMLQYKCTLSRARLLIPRGVFQFQTCVRGGEGSKMWGFSIMHTIIPQFTRKVSNKTGV